MASNIIQLILSVKDITKSGLDSAKKNLDGMKGAADKVAGSVLNLKNAFIGLLATAGLGTVVKDFKEFDDLMRQAGAISGATGKQFEGMTEIALRMGRETRYTASNAADGLVKMSMAGFSASEQIAALPGIMQLAAAGNMDIATSTDIAAGALRTYGVDASNLSSINDIFVKTFTNTNSSLVELGEGFKYVAPVAKNLGVPIEDLMAAMGKLHDNGIKGSMAGTALRGALGALMNPTDEEAKLMEGLSDRIGGVGFQVKDAQGNFVGFTNVIKQLEQAGLRGDEALELFGLRAGPAMAALVGAGSKSLENLKTKLENAGGTAADIATKMEAGIGGALRTLQSRFEGFRIALGKGFDAAVTGAFQYFVAEFDKGTAAIENFIKAGDYQAWADKLKSAFISVYEGIKTLIDWFTTLLPIIIPVFTRFLELAPVIVSVAVAAKAASIAIGIMSTAVGLLSLSMGSATITTWLKHVQSSSKIIGIAQVATASWQTALVSVAAVGAAAFVGWQVGKLIGEFKLTTLTFGLLGEKGKTVNQIMQEMYDNTDTLGEKFLLLANPIAAVLKLWDKMFGDSSTKVQTQIDNIDPLLEKLKKFAEFKLPAGFADAGVKGIQDLNKELNMSKLYWDTYLRKAELAGDTAGIDKAKQALSSLKDMQEQLNTAVSSEAQALQTAQAAHDSYVAHVKGTKDILLRGLEDYAQKEIETAEKAFYKKEEFNGKQIKDVEALAVIKKGIEERLQKDTEKIRLDTAAQLQETAAEELRLLEETKNLKIKKTQEEIDAGVISNKKGQEIIRNDLEQYENDKRQLTLTTSQEVANEQIKINKEKVDKYIEGLKSESTQAKAEYETRIAEIDTLEQKGTISHEKAIKEKEKADKDYYEGQIKAIDEMAKKALENGQIEEYKKLLDEKKKLEADFGKSQVEIAQSVKEQKEALANAELAVAQAEKDQELNMIQTLENQGIISAEQAAERKKQVEIDFLNFKKEQIFAATQAVIDGAETETAAYKEAVAQRMAAENEVAAAKIPPPKTPSGGAGGGGGEGGGGEDEDAEAERRRWQDAGDALKEMRAEIDKYTTGLTASQKAAELTGEALVDLTEKTREWGRAIPAIMPYIELPVAFNEALHTLEDIELLSSNAFSNASWLSGAGEMLKILEEAKEQFDVIAQSAKNMGLNVDLSNKTLSQAAEDVANRIEGWRDFNDSLLEISGSMQTLGQIDVSNAGVGLDEFAEKIKAVRDAYGRGEIEDAKNMADSVVDAYQAIYDAASEKIETLEDDWTEYGDKVIEINDKIAGIETTAAEQIRSLKRDMMTEEEVWQDKRLEYEEIYAAAVKELNQGNVDAAVEMFETARDIAGDLATEVKDVNGEAVLSLADATAQATALITQASDAAKTALSNQADSLSKQQSNIRTEIDTTVSSMSNMSKQITAMQTDFTVNMMGKGSAALPISEKIAVVSGQVGQLSGFIGSQTPSFTADFAGMTGGLDSVKTGIETIGSTWEATAQKIKSIVPNLTLDTSQVISGLQGMAQGLSTTGRGSGSVAAIKRATGGIVPGSGSGDTVGASLPAGSFVLNKGMTDVLLTPGELVLPPSVYNENKTFWKNLNTGNLNPPRFATGGEIQKTNIQDIGTVKLEIGNQSFPVQGSVNVLTELNKTLRRYKLQNI